VRTSHLKEATLTGSYWHGIFRSDIVQTSRRFLGGVGFIRTLGVGVGFFNLIPTPEAQLNYFLHRTPKLGILTRAW